MRFDSIRALAGVFHHEIDNSKCDVGHLSIQLSCASKSLPNGVKRFSVQLECKAGCGCLIETYGIEAEKLEEKVRKIQTMLGDESSDHSDIASEGLNMLFPELEIAG
jgi:hypothetical protein